MRAFLIVLEMLATALQVLGGQKDKRDKNKNRFILGGLVLLIVFRAFSYVADEKERKEGARKDAKLAMQEALLKKMGEKELNAAYLAVKQEEGKLQRLENMQSELVEKLRKEGEGAPASQLAAKPAEAKP